MASPNQATNISTQEAFNPIETYGIAPVPISTANNRNNSTHKIGRVKSGKREEKKTQAKYLNALKLTKKKVDLTTKDNCIAYMLQMGRNCDLTFVKTDEEGFPIFSAKNRDEEELLESRPKKDFEAINF